MERTQSKTDKVRRLPARIYGEECQGVVTGNVFRPCLGNLARLEQHLSVEPVPALQLKECFAE